MPTPAIAHSFDADARALAMLWLDAGSDGRQLREQADRLLAQALAAGERRTAWLSSAFEALRLAVLQPQDDSVSARVWRQLQTLQTAGCPRALKLVEAAWVHVLLQITADPAELGCAVEALRKHGAPQADTRPAEERFWTDAGLARLHIALGRPAEALACARQAQAQVQAQAQAQTNTQAESTPHCLLHAQARSVLHQALLAAGQAEPAALPALQPAAAGHDTRHTGLRPGDLLRALDKARASADASAREQAAQRRFLAHVAHELRNPAAGVAGLSSLMLETALSAQQREHMLHIQQAAQMLTSLCDDLLALARLEAGGFALRPAPLDVAAVLQDVTDSLLPLAQAKQLGLSCSVTPALPPLLLCDRLRLQQVLMNLLSNAIKYTQQGWVALQASWQPDPHGHPSGWLRVAVQDTGPGLDALAQAQLFAEHMKPDTPAPAAVHSHGIGLALCRQLVQQMNGEIGVHSHPGEGSSFWFSLPLPVAGAALPS